MILQKSTKMVRILEFSLVTYGHSNKIFFLHRAASSLLHKHFLLCLNVCCSQWYAQDWKTVNKIKTWVRVVSSWRGCDRVQGQTYTTSEPDPASNALTISSRWGKLTWNGKWYSILAGEKVKNKKCIYHVLFVLAENVHKENQKIIIQVFGQKQEKERWISYTSCQTWITYLEFIPRPLFSFSFQTSVQLFLKCPVACFNLQSDVDFSVALTNSDGENPSFIVT